MGKSVIIIHPGTLILHTSITLIPFPCDSSQQLHCKKRGHYYYYYYYYL